MKKQLSEINKLLIQHFGIPHRNKRNPKPLDILIGTILSQNTNDKNSYKAYLNLKSNVKSWQEIIDMPMTRLENLIKVAGLGKQKAETINSLVNNLYSRKKNLSLKHLFKLDNDSIINELTQFKGVGVKTASCVLLFSLGRNVCPVDTHVFRILYRLGIVQSSSPEKTYYEIKDFIPKNSAHSLHTNLLRLGREYCLPSNPKCSICPLEKKCQYPDKNLNQTDKKKINNFFLLDSI